MGQEAPPRVTDQCTLCFIIGPFLLLPQQNDTSCLIYDLGQLTACS